MTLVLSALECVQSGYRSDELFRLLKTGLTELQTEEIAALENYALLWNLKRQAVAGAVYHASQGFLRK